MVAYEIVGICVVAIMLAMSVLWIKEHIRVKGIEDDATGDSQDPSQRPTNGRHNPS